MYLQILARTIEISSERSNQGVDSNVTPEIRMVRSPPCGSHQGLGMAGSGRGRQVKDSISCYEPCADEPVGAVSLHPSWRLKKQVSCCPH